MATKVSYDGYSLIAGYGGIFLALGLSTMGAAIGSVKGFKAAADLISIKSSYLISSMFSIIMSGVIAIYGLLVSVIIQDKSKFIL